MKHIDAERLSGLLNAAPGGDPARVRAALAKARALQRLTLEEAAALLTLDDAALESELFAAAGAVKDEIYGRRVVLFAPLYASNHCVNACVYCSFRRDNRTLHRRALTPEEVGEQTAVLLRKGHKRALLVTGEAGAGGMKPADYALECVRAVYGASSGPHRIRRVNINIAPLEVDDYRRFKAAGIGTYQLFQETYHDATYRAVHPAGPKADPDRRLDAIDRAFSAGIDDVGLGVLFGLYDWRFEVLGLLSHVEHLERTHGVGPHTLSVPRLEPAPGTAIPRAWGVGDADFLRLVAILRLAVPYTGIILSTREPAGMRDRLLDLGVSQVSADSRTSPGGYADGEDPGDECQFFLNDHRTLDEMVGALLSRAYLPSFCTACYRRDRTGERFMNLARPGLIKGNCTVNALVTLQEYLDDFASPAVREAGAKILQEGGERLDGPRRAEFQVLLNHVLQGHRDVHV